MSVVGDLPEVGMKTIFCGIFKYKTAFEYYLCLIELTCLHMERERERERERVNIHRGG